MLDGNVLLPLVLVPAPFIEDFPLSVASRSPATHTSWQRRVPTLAEMPREPFWVWLFVRTANAAPVALALFGIRWGKDVSINRLEEALAVTCVVTSALAIVPGGRRRRRVNCG